MSSLLHFDQWPIGGGLVGRPRTTWLRSVDDEFQSLNLGLEEG